MLLLLACETPIVEHPKADDTGEASEAFALASLVPDSGPASGGTAVSVRGAGFSDATTVALDGEACASLTFLSSSELLCVTPDHAAGEVEAVVTEGHATGALAFTFVAEDTGDPTPPDTGDDTGDSGDSGDSGVDSGDSGDTGEPVELVPVDYCHVQYPCEMTLAPHEESELVYVWVYQAGVTEGAGRGMGLMVEVGVGDDGSVPDDGWDWAPGAYNLDKDGLFAGDLANDEYMGAFDGPVENGAYDYAGRVSADGGASWTYCDLGGDTCGGAGSDDGYSPAEAGRLTVE
jgi:hypothetical protein